MAKKSQYYISGGPDYIDLDLSYAQVNLQGEQISVIGTAGVDLLFVRPGVAVDFTGSGGGIDRLYLTGNLADYTASASGLNLTLSRNLGTPALSESVMLTRGSPVDVVVFANGTTSVTALLSQARTGILATVAGETSLTPVLPATLASTITGFALDPSVFATFQPGVAFIAVGSAGVDTVYVKAGSHVDASGLGGGIDLIYFTGTWSSYTKTAVGTKMTFTRTIGGNTETVVVAASSGSLSDQLIFADGAVRSLDAKNIVAANANALLSSAPSYNASLTTPIDAGSAVPLITALSNDSGTSQTDFNTNVTTQSVHGTFTGTLAAGQLIQVSSNGGASWVTASVTVTSNAGGTFDAVGLTLQPGLGKVLSLQTISASNVVVAGASHAYTLDTVAPSSVVSTLSFSADTGLAGDFITRSAAQTVSGTLSAATQAGEVVKVSLDNGVTWVTASNIIGTASFSAAGFILTQSDTLQARVEDAAGNTGAIKSQAYTLDTVAPSLTVALTLAGSTISNAEAHAAAGVLSMTAEAGATLAVTLTGAAGSVSHTLSATGAEQLLVLTDADIAGVGQGNVSVQVAATDAAGNVTSASKSLLLDTQAPVPLLTAHAGQDVYLSANEASVTIDVTYPNLAANDTLQLVLDGVNLNTLHTVTTAEVAAGMVSIAIAKAVIGAEGSHVFTLLATDVAGNVGSATGLTIVLDSVSPVPTIAMPAGESSTVSAAQTTLNVEVRYSGLQAGDGIQLQVGNVNAGASYTVTALDASAQVATVPILTALLKADDSSKSISMIVTDLAGNIGGSNALPIGVDTTAPTTVVNTLVFSNDSGASATDFITNNAAQTISGTLSAGTVSGEVVKVSLDNGVTWVAASNTLGSSSFSLTNQTLAASNTLVARVEDAVGNPSTAKSQLYVLDQTVAAPGVSLASDSGVSASDGVSRLGTMQVSGLEPGASWQYSVDGAPFVNGTGTSFTLSAGSHAATAIQVRQTDLAGNLSAPGSNAAAITIDSVALAPGIVLASDTGSSASDGISTLGLVNVTGLENNAVWQYSVDSGASFITGTGSSFILAEGTHAINSVQVRQTDVAGNTSLAGLNSGAITIDNAVPASPTVALASDNGVSGSDGVTNLGLINVSALEAGAAWEYSINGGTSWNVGTGSGFTLAQGTYAVDAVQVHQIDVAGNVSTPAIISSAMLIDTTLPSVPGLVLASDSGANASDGVSMIGAVNVSGLEANARWEYSTSSGASGAWIAGTGASFTLAPGGYAAGTVQVHQIDVAGNVSAPGLNALTFAIDNSAPSAPTVQLASDTGGSASDGVSTLGLVNVLGLEANASWEYSVSSGVSGSWIAASGSSFTLLAGSHAAGSVQVRQTDLAGNLGLAGLSVTDITILAAPTTPGVLLATDSGVSSSDGISKVGLITVTALSANTTWQYSLDSGNNWSNGTGNSFAVVAGAYASGMLQVRQIDAAGNVSQPGSNLQAITIDTSALAPTLTLASDSGPSDGISNVAQVNVSGLEAGATWQYSINSGATFIPGSGSSFILTEGSHLSGTVQVKQTDIAGNLSAVGINSSVIVIDTHAPVAPTLALASDTGVSGSDFVTQIGTVNVTSVEAGAVWQYSTDGGVSWITGSGASFTLNEGSYAPNMVRVHQTDVAGNVSAATMLASAITIDQTPPDSLSVAVANDTGVSAFDNITQVGLVTVAGIELGAVWQYSTNSGASWSSGTGSSFTLLDGTYSANTIQVQQTDLAGNTSIVGANAAAIVIDNTGPSNTVNTLRLSADTGVSATDFITNTALQTISGTLSAPTQADQVVRVSTDNGSNWVLANNVVGSNTFSVAGLVLAHSDTLLARVEDVAGNVGASKSQAFTLDLAAPSLTVTQTAAGGTINNAAAHAAAGVISIQAEAGALVAVVLTGTAGSVNRSFTASGAAQPLVLSDADMLLLGQGLISIVGKATDLAGNLSSVTNSVFLDTQAPAPIVSPAAGQDRFLNATETSVTLDVAYPGLALGDSVQWLLNGANFNAVHSVTAAEASAGKLSLLVAKATLGADGDYAFSVQATDVAGNVGGGSALHVIVDSVAPAPAIAIKSGESAVVNAAQATLDLIVSYSGLALGDVLQLQIAGVDKGAAYTVTSADVTAGTATVAILTSLIKTDETAKSISMTATDLAGNHGSSNALTITIDSSTPIGIVSTLAFSHDTGPSATDFVTNIAAQTLTGTLSAPTDTGDLVRVSLDNGVSWTAAVNSTGSTSFSLSGLTLVGSNILQVRVENASGNPGATHSQAYLLDQSVATPVLSFASDTGASASDGLTNIGLINVSGLEAKGTWEYSLDNVLWLAGTGSALLLPEGAHGVGTVHVRQTDLAGNLSPAVTNAFALTLDTTIATPVLTLASDTGASASDGVSQVGLINVGGLEANAVWQYSVDGGVTFISGTGSSFSIAEGTHVANSVQVRQTDVAGNISVVGINSGVISIDNVVPALLGVALASDTGVSASDGVTKLGLVNIAGLEAGASWEYSLDAGLSFSLGSGSSFTLTEGTYGANQIQVHQIDLAGNLGPAARIGAAIVFDSTPPSAPTLALASDTGSGVSDGVTTAGLVNVTGLESGASWEYSVNSGTNWNGGSGSSFTLAVGVHGLGSVQVRQTDVAGNTSIAGQNAAAITVDHSAPSALTLVLASDTGFANNDGITRLGAMTVGALELNASWEYNTGSGWNAGTGSAFTLPEGTYSAGLVQVRQTDLAGNLGPVTGSTTLITVDSTVPSAPTATLATDTGASASDGISKNGLMLVTGLETALHTSWQYSVDSGNSWLNGIGSSFVLAEGAHAALSVQVRQIDVAGNLSAPSSNAQALTVDNAVLTPSVALASDSGASDGVTNTPTVNVAGLEAGTVWQYSVDSGAHFSVGTGSSFVLSEGAHPIGTVQVKQTDLAGNSSAIGSNPGALVIDTIAPSTPTLALASDSGASGSDFVTNVGTLNVANLEAGTAWQYSVDGGASWITGSGASFTLAEGSYGSQVVRVRQVDVANNLSGEAMIASAITVDTTTPVSLALVLASDTGLSPIDNITQSGLVNVGAIEVGTLWQYSINSGSTWNTGTGSSFTLAEGTHGANTVQVRQTDLAGNTSVTASNLAAIVIDTIAPSNTVNTLSLSVDAGASASDFVTNTALQTISGKLSFVTQADEVVQLSLDGGVNWVSASNTVGSNSFSASGLTLLASGVLSARVVEVAGNLGAVKSQAYLLDTVAPTLTQSVTAAVINAAAAHAAAGFISLTAEAGATVAVLVTGTAGSVTRSFSATGAAQAVLLSDADLLHLGQGALSIASSATDLAGNLTQASNTVLLDTQVPTPLLSIAAGQDKYLNAAETGITLEVAYPALAAGDSVQVILDGAALNAAHLVTAPEASAGKVSLTVAKSSIGADADHIFTLQVSDVAGNVSSNLSAVHVILDSVTPAPVIALKSGESSVVNAAESSLDIDVSYSGLAIGDVLQLQIAGVNQGAAYTVTSADVSAGVAVVTILTALIKTDDTAKSIAMSATDLAGNHASSNALIITVDNSSPIAIVSTLALSNDTGASALDFVTNTAAQTISGTLSAPTDTGDLVRISLDNGANWISAVNSAGSTSFSLSGVTLVASNTLQVRVENSNGNPGVAHLQAYVLDQSVATPTLSLGSDSGVSASDGITKLGLINVAGLEANGSWEYNTSGTWLPGTGSSFILPEGAHGAGTVLVRQTDLAGNVSVVAQNASAMTVDLTILTPVLSLTSDTGVSASDGFSQLAVVTVNGLEANAVWQYSVDGGVHFISGSGSSFTLTEGSHAANALQVRQTDVAGNISALGMNSSAITIDTITPAAPLVALGSDSGVSASDGVTKSGVLNVAALEANASWEYSSDGGLSFTLGSGSSFTLADGSYGANTIQVHQLDLAGNISNVAQIGAVIVVDTSAPSAPILTLASDTGASASDGVSKVGIVSVAGLEAGASWEYSVNGGTNWSIGTGASFILSAGSRLSGAVQVHQTDVAGNTSLVGQNAATLTIDQSAPLAPSLTLASDTGFSNNDGVTRLGLMNVGGLEVNASWEYNLGSGWNAGTGTSFTLPAGIYSAGLVQVRQTDLAGNLGPATASSSLLTVDTALPNAPSATLASDTGVSASDAISRNGLMAVTGLETPNGTTWQYSLDSGNSWSNGTGSSFVLGEGVHLAASVQVRQIDVAGNISAVSSNAQAITVDTIALAPGLALATDSGANDGVTNVPSVNLIGLEAGAVWQYSVDSGAHFNLGTGSSFILSEGPHASGTVQARQTDLAGNTSVAGFNAGAILIDTLAPGTPTLVLASDSGLSASDGVSNVGTVTVANLEAGAVWQYSIDSGVSWITGFGTSFTLAEGSYAASAVRVHQTDLAGNVSGVNLIANAMVIDLSAPDTMSVVLVSDSGVSALDNITNAGLVNVLGIEAGTVWQYSIDSGVHWQIGTGSSFTLAEGAHEANTVKVQQTDRAGNLSVMGNNYVVIVVDTVAPATTVSSLSLSADSGASASDFITNVAAQTIRGVLSATTQPGELVRLSLDGGANWLTADNLIGSTSFSLAGLTLAGNGVLLARVEDTAGNAGANRSQAYTLDTIAPVLTQTLAGSTINSAMAHAPAGLLSLNGEVGAALSVTLTGTAGLVTHSMTATGAAQAVLLSDAELLTLGQGNLSVVTSATDLAGNVTSVSNTALLDTQAPTPLLSIAVGQDRYLNAAESSITLEVAYPALALGDSVQFLLDGAHLYGAQSVTAAQVAAGKVSLLIAKADLGGEGAHLVSVQATDVAGNVASATALPLLIDTVTPQPTIAIQSGEDAVVTAPENVLHIEVRYSALAAGDVLQLQIGGVNAGAAYTVTSADVAATVATVAVQTVLLKTDDSTKLIAMTATDLAGNQGVSTALSIAVDTASPHASVTSLAFSADSGTAGDFITNVAAQTISITLSAASAASEIVQVSLDNGVNWSTATNSGDSIHYSFSGVVLNGSNTLQARVQNVAGNSSAAKVQAFVLDQSVATPGMSLATDSGVSASDQVSKVGVLNLTGLESKASWEYSTDSGASFTAGSGTSFTLAEGSHAIGTVQVRQTDLAGNLSAVGSNASVMTIKTTSATPSFALATDSGAAASDGVTQVGLITVSGIEANATWEFSLDQGSHWQPGSGNHFVLAEGGHAAQTVQVRQTDVAGNLSSVASNNLALVIDNAAPAAPSAALTIDSGASASDGVSNLGALSVVGLEPGATWAYSTDSGASFTLGSGSSFTLAAGTHGANSVQVRQTDLAGNLGVAFKLAGVTIVDSVAPLAPTMALASDTGSNASDGVTMQGVLNVTALEPSASWQYSIDSASHWLTGSGSSFTLAAGTYGSGTVQVQQIDLAGNVGVAAANPAVLVVDITPPLALSLVLASDSGNTASDGISRLGAITVGALEAGASWEYNLGSGWNAGSGSSFTLPEGVYSAGAVQARQTDLAGNLGLASANASNITVDLTPPAMPAFAFATDTGISASDGFTKNGLINVTGLETGTGATWQYSSDSGVTWLAGSNSSFVLAEGVHALASVQVRQMDVAGNVSVAVSTQILSVDNSALAPVLVLATDSGISASDGNTRFNTVNVTGLETGAAWSYSVNSGGAFQVGSGSSFVLTEGGHALGSVQVKQTDLAGNNSVISANNVAFTIDTQTPVTPTLALGSDTGNGSDWITYAGQVNVANLEAGAIWQYSVDGGANWITGSGTSFTLLEGTYALNHVQVHQFDLAGNTSGMSSIAHAITVDTTLPTPMSVALASDTGASSFDNVTGNGLVNVSGIDSDTVWQYSINGGVSFITGTGSSFTLSEGTHAVASVQVHQTDVAGNVSVLGSNFAAIVIDTTAPTLPLLTLASDTGVSASDGVTKSGLMNVTGLEAGGSWQYSSNGGSSFSVGTGSSFTLLEGSYGVNSVQVKQSDPAGNTSPLASIASAITVDLTPPAIMTLVLATDTGSSASDGFSKIGVVNVTGMEAGAVWQYSIDSGASFVTGTGASFTLADGVHAINSVQVRQTDVAGNISTAALNPGLITIKGSAPVAPTVALATDAGTFASDGITNASLMTVGLLETNVVWEYSVNGGTNFVTGTGSSFALIEGTHAANSIVVRQTDLAGNVSPIKTVTGVIVIDTVAPTAAAFVMPSDSGISHSDGITNASFVTVTGLETNATVQFSINSGSTWLAGTSGGFTLPDGTYAAGVLKVRQSDVAGNPSPTVSSTTAITIDTVAPVTPLFSLATDTGISASDGFSKIGLVNVTALETSAVWEYSINSGSNWATGSGGGFTLAEGSYAAHAVQLRQTDVAGNVSVVGSNASVMSIDNSAPVAPSAVLASDTGASASDSITKLGTINVGNLESSASWEYSINNSTTWQPGTGSSFILPEATYAAGQVQVRQTDLAGNRSTAGSAVGLTVDVTAPTAAALVLASDTGVSASDGVSSNGLINVTALDASAIWQHTVDNGVTWITGTGGNFTLLEGTYGAGAVQVRQVDVAGNISAVSALAGAIKIDSTAPVAPGMSLATDSGSSASDGISKYGVVNVAGLEAASGSSWAYSINSGTLYQAGSGSSFTLADGIYAAGTVLTRQTDVAGNVSANATAAAFTINNTVPSAIVSDNVPGTVNATSGTIVYTYAFNEKVNPLSSSGANFSVSHGSITSVNDAAGSGTTWQVTITPDQNVASGTIGVTLLGGTVQDAAGNTNAQAINALQVIDTLKPAPAITIASGQDSHISIIETYVDMVVTSTSLAVGDVVQMQLSNVNLGLPHTVTSLDVSSGSVSMRINKADLGADGSKSVTAHVSDLAGNSGDSIGQALDLVTHPEFTSSLSNVTNLDVSSPIVLTANELLSSGVAGKFIHIVDDGGSGGGTGYDGESTTHTQDIDAGSAMVSIVNYQIIIKPSFNLDLSSHYHILVDAGAFLDAGGIGSAAITTTVGAIGFNTVTPGGGGSASTLADAAPSIKITSTDTHVDSYRWWNIEGVGSIGAPNATQFDLGTASIAMVFKDFDPAGSTYDATNGGTDGIGVGANPFFLKVKNFGADDLIYVDDQFNNINKLNNLNYSSFDNNGNAPTRVSFDAYSGLSSNNGSGVIDITLASPNNANAFDSLAALKALLGTTGNSIISG